MNRREFLKDATTLGMGVAGVVSAVELHAGAQAKPAAAPEKAGPPVNCAVIGINQQGRDILAALAKIGAGAPVAAVCDTFSAPVFVKKANAIAPSAAFVDDYRKVLDRKDIQAVFIATPSHKHKQIAIDALAAGKHVYCEAPLATDLADAKAIAQAGLAAKTTFMPGLQLRSNGQHVHILGFVRSRAMGDLAFGRAQWHNRDSWRRPSPTPERMKELNWRLANETSLGLPGEIGIHQIDIANWYLKSLPVSVTGFGGVMGWRDGREVPDTVQCVVEYPGNFRFFYDATLVNSFEGSYETFYGVSSAIQIRDQRGWLFKESDANTLGWEGFARRDDMSIGVPANGSGLRVGVGIALVADATKQLALGKDPGKVGTDVSRTALYQSVETFVNCLRSNTKPNVGPLEGYQANVVAAKCNEAVLKGTKVTFEKEWFTL